MNDSIWGTSDPNYDIDGISIDKPSCDGSGDCVHVCPTNSLTLVSAYVEQTLYSKTLYVNLNSCILCGACEAACPRGSIDVFTGGGGGGGLGNGGGGGGGAYAAIAPVIQINLNNRLECFKTIPDNQNTKYKVVLNSHKGIFGGNKPGHGFITLEKSNGNNMQRLSFGFYPQVSINSLLLQPVKSAIGEESGDVTRFSDARYTIDTLTKTQFDNIIQTAKSLSNEYYDLNDYNCVHYAVDVFNAAGPPTGPISNSGFVTPDDLFNYITTIKSISGNNSIKTENNRKSVPPSTNCPD